MTPRVNLSPAELGDCAELLGAIARQSFEKGAGLRFEVNAQAFSENVVEACLRRIVAKEGWTAERTETGIVAIRDKRTRKAIF